MWSLHIFLPKRRLSPEEGQQKLAEIQKAIENNQNSGGMGGFTVLQVPGATTENPYPEWLKEALIKAIPGAKFDTVNQIIFARFKDPDHAQEHAEYYAKWIHTLFKQFYKSDPAKYELVNKIETRAMEEAVEAYGMETF